jgi:putative outer membrane protein, probably involved in nutrient binding
MKKWAGVDPQNGDPLWYVNGEDGKTTNDYNKAGYGLQGSAMPTYYGGVDTKLSYKNFTLSADLTYSGGNKIVDTFASYVNSDGGLLSSYPGNGSQVGNYWTPENKNARDPKPILGKGNRNATSFSTRYQYKGDFVRLQTVRFSYRVKPEFLDGTYLKGLEFYVLGNNVWTHNFDKNYKGDPDLNIGGETSFTLPTLRTYSFGVNVNL